MTRAIRIIVASGLLAAALAATATQAADKVLKFARFRVQDKIVYGVVEGERVREISGSPFEPWHPTDRVHSLAAVQLLVPTQPTQVIAMAGNYRSHIQGASDNLLPKFQIPQPFLKPPACLVPSGAEIVIPKGTQDVHYEAEMVVVIGRTAADVPEDKALEYVLGVTCGNDVSARDWQTNDVQWWRAKGCDTFGPCGPFIVSGVDYDNLLLQLRLNGQTKQKQSTGDLIHGVAAIVSFVSQHITLQPGDLIFTGTPGNTSPIKAGDVVEVELEQAGVLSNPVVAE